MGDLTLEIVVSKNKSGWDLSNFRGMLQGLETGAMLFLSSWYLGKLYNVEGFLIKRIIITEKFAFKKKIAMF